MTTLCDFKKGKYQCTYKKKNGEKYCKKHLPGTQLDKDKNKKTFNKECPICLESEDRKENGNMLILSCLHRIHSKCSEGLTNLKCPLCQQMVINWPPKIQTKIIKNGKRVKKEVEDEEREVLIQEQQRQQEYINRLRLYINPPPKVEIIAALEYLRDQEIPERYIPRNITIARQRNRNNMQPGVLFMTIVSQVLNKINEEIPDINENLTNSDDSDNEDPFEFENDQLSIQNPNLNVKFEEFD